MDADIKALSDSLIYEILNALGLPKTERMRDVIAPLFCKATKRLATLGIGFDRQVAKFGFSRAAEWILPGFVREVTERGAEQVPPEGPLLVVSNHPGTYDSLLIASRLGRDDLKIITGDIPFLRGLPRAREHFLSLTQDINQRMNIVRAAIHHLQQPGAGRGHALASGHAADEGDAGHARGRDQRRAGLPGAGHHVEHAGRQTGLVQQVGNL